jgi:hypothetical protein
VNIGGNKVIRGGNGIVDGLVDDVNWTVLMETMERRGFKHLEDIDARLTPSPPTYIYKRYKVLTDLFAVRG